MSSSKWQKMFPDATMNIPEHLQEGAQTFGSYVKAIETANAPGHYIYILGWMLDIDFPLTGTPNPAYGKKGEHYFKGDKTLFKLLETAAGKGVEIRVLIWSNPLYLNQIIEAIERIRTLPGAIAYGDNETYITPGGRKLLADLEVPIGELVKRIRRLHKKDKKLIKDGLDINVDAILDQLMGLIRQRKVGAHHEKILLVKGQDGLISFCGGIDINPNRFTGQHDAAVKITGPEAHKILEKFITRWNNHIAAREDNPLPDMTNELNPLPVIDTAGRLKKVQVIGTFNSVDGGIKTRSVKDNYLKILDAARNYIYIEDQYLVNLDVARALNKKIKEPDFLKLVIVIQDCRQTTDLMLTDRKRGLFMQTILDGASTDERKKFSIFMLDDDLARRLNRHVAIHGKILVVDDELAIIGSANVNQRSFTLDSETSAIIFEPAEGYYRDNFAYKVRKTIWEDLVYNKPALGDITWEELDRIVAMGPGYSLLTHYRKSIDDLDDRIKDIIRPHSVETAIVLTTLFSDDPVKAIQAVSVATPLVVDELFKLIWEHIIDPEIN